MPKIEIAPVDEKSKPTAEAIKASFGFSCLIDDIHSIKRIAARTQQKSAADGIPYSRERTFMDLVMCHCNGTPLNLAKLESASDVDFSADVYGIRQHLDRDTGKIDDTFKPLAATAAAAPLTPG